jgi:hypothetical protein
MRLISLLATVALSGCVTGESDFVWDHPNSNEQQFHMDSGQCRAQAFQMPGSSLRRSVVVFESCMQGKGYYKRPARS